jgi:hypothetical protein
VAARFRAYDVKDGQVIGFHKVHASNPFTARATLPQTFAFPTFSDPNGTVSLVQILTGPYAGTWISPDDPGVSFSDD